MTGGIYLDHHATTPCDPRVLDQMLPWLGARCGNPGSPHAWGRDARAAVARARQQVASLLRGSPPEVVFTAGATEALNLALLGSTARPSAGRRRLLVSPIEHPAVLVTCRWLARRGFEVVELPIGPSGVVDPEDVRAALDERVLLVALMAANNEIGTLQPVAEVAALCREVDARLVCDAVQYAGHLPISAPGLGADLVAISAHKLYGPKGVGALWVRGGAAAQRLDPIAHGGGQERGLRPGTVNVPGVVGLGAACALCESAQTTEPGRLRALRHRLLAELRAGLGDVILHGDPVRRLPHNLSVAIPGVEAHRLIEALDDVAVSAGSACSSASGGRSHVLQAIGVRGDLLHATIRIGLGRGNDEAAVDHAARRVVDAARRLRGR